MDFGEGDASKSNSMFRSDSPVASVADAEYDRLTDLAGAEMDETKRTVLWKQAQKVVHDNYYVAAVWQAASIYGMSRKLNWSAEFGDNFDLSGVKVSE